MVLRFGPCAATLLEPDVKNAQTLILVPPSGSVVLFTGNEKREAMKVAAAEKEKKDAKKKDGSNKREKESEGSSDSE